MNIKFEEDSIELIHQEEDPSDFIENQHLKQFNLSSNIDLRNIICITFSTELACVVLYPFNVRLMHSLMQFTVSSLPLPIIDICYSLRYYLLWHFHNSYLIFLLALDYDSISLLRIIQCAYVLAIMCLMSFFSLEISILFPFLLSRFIPVFPINPCANFLSLVSNHSVGEWLTRCPAISEASSKSVRSLSE